MSLRAVLFDLDGTLVSTERENCLALTRALERGQGIVASQAERDFVIGHSWVEIYKMISSNHPDLSWTQAELIAATAHQRELIFAESGMQCMPGARETVARFAHLRRAVVTGSSRAEAGQSLRSMGWTETFDVVFAAEDVPTSKPAPDGYLMAARHLQVEPSECLVCEDSSAGIGAGVAAGAKVVAIRAGNFLGQDQSAAHVIIDTLEQLTVEVANSLFAD